MGKELILFAALLGQMPPGVVPDVSVVPDMALVPLADPECEVGVLVRNLSEVELAGVKLELLGSPPCAMTVLPEEFERISPSDRARFVLRFRRTAASARQRFLVDLRLASRHRPELVGFSLLIDAGRKRTDAQRGWLDVGVVRVGASSSVVRSATLVLLALVPIVLLLLLGRRFKRRAEQNPPKSSGEP